MGEWAIHMVALGVCAWQDWKEREVSLWKIVVYGIVVLAVKCTKGFPLSDPKGLIQGIGGLFPGVFLLTAGRLSQEAVGYGDGFLVLIIGFSLGFWKTLGILWTAFAGVFLTAVLICLRRQKKRNIEIPFVPFLFCGMAGTVFQVLR